MMRLRRASVIALSLLTSTATAHAECAWVLWTKQALLTKPESAPEYALQAGYKRIEDCVAALDQKIPNLRGTTRIWGDKAWMCLPDSIDPRTSR
jgi:hypothetical protein